jgi:hypothetical protein
MTALINHSEVRREAKLMHGRLGFLQVPAKAMDLFVFHTVQTDSGAHLGSYSVGVQGSWSGEGWPGHEADPLTSIQC